MRNLIVIRASEPHEHEPDAVIEFIGHHVRHAMDTGDQFELDEWLDVLARVEETRTLACLTAKWN